MTCHRHLSPKKIDTQKAPPPFPLPRAAIGAHNLACTGHVGFSLPGGGGVKRAPQNGGGGRVRETGSIDRHH